MIWVVDHNDSFVANLARYFTLLRQNVTILSMDECIHATQNSPLPNAVILSPGLIIQLIIQDYPMDTTSSTCADARSMLRTSNACRGTGRKGPRAQRPRHGIATSIQHNQTGLFQLLPKGFLVAHYHALMSRALGLLTLMLLVKRAKSWAYLTPPYLYMVFSITLNQF